MQLSIISTLYLSEPYLDEFHERISAAASSIEGSYELILVNDGSPDQSLRRALQLQQHDLHLKILDLSRNFGHHEAGMIGLEHAQGEYIFLIDSDLEEAPELLKQFWLELHSDSIIDAVYGVQSTRKGNWFERISGHSFYWLFNQISEIKIPCNLLTVRLMKKQFVSTVLQYHEQHLFLAGMMAHAGFNQKPVLVHKNSKKNSSYTFIKQLKLFSTCILSFSSKPLYCLFILGVLFSVMSILSGMITAVKLAILGASGFSTFYMITLSTFFLSGIVMMCTGILGLYIGRIYDQVKNRPRAIIKTIYPSGHTDEQS